MYSYLRRLWGEGVRELLWNHEEQKMKESALTALQRAGVDVAGLVHPGEPAAVGAAALGRRVRTGAVHSHHAPAAAH